MFEKITLRIFLFSLVACASLILFIVWSGGPDSERPQIYFQTAATLFILGLASFLSWLVMFLYRLRTLLSS
jgi:hypothetical protein